MAGLILLGALLVIGTPVLALLAFNRVQKLAERVDGLRTQDLISRIYALEQKLDRLEKLLHARTVPPEPVAPEVLVIKVPAAPAGSSAETRQAPPPHAPLDGSGVTRAAALATVSGPTCAHATPHRHDQRHHQCPSAPTFPTISHTSASSSHDLESLIGGSWFNRLGILALIVAVCLFLKYAFDNNWIGPTGRVAIGVFLGAAMLPWSHWLLGRGYSYFSEGIAALGQATLLLSIWAGCRYYTLFSLDVGFAAMIVVTAVMAAVAIGRNSERIAVLSLIGGFLTPALLSTGRDQEFALFTYLLILGAGFLVTAAFRNWSSLAPISFFLTQIYFWGYYSEFYRPAKLAMTLTFATLFFLLFMALPAIRAARTSTLETLELFVVLLNSFAYMAALYTMLWPDYRWPLTLAVLLLSALHLGIARFRAFEKNGRVDRVATASRRARAYVCHHRDSDPPGRQMDHLGVCSRSSAVDSHELPFTGAVAACSRFHFAGNRCLARPLYSLARAAVHFQRALRNVPRRDRLHGLRALFRAATAIKSGR